MPFDTGTIILIGFGIVLLLFIIVLWKSKRIRFIVRSKIHVPFRPSGYVKRVLRNELEAAKAGTKYETFEAFLKDCPYYSVDDTILGKSIRNILKTAGINFQQYVWIRKNATKDKTAYIRRDEEDKTLLHDKGTYGLPGDYSKDVIYYDIEDFRPLIDNSNDINWKNPDMCADVITAITNSKSMASLDKTDNMGILPWISIGITCIAILAIIVVYYHGTQQDKMITDVYNLVNETRRP